MAGILEGSGEKERHKLLNTYRFYFAQNSTEEDGLCSAVAEDDLQSTGSFDTVEQFWAYYNHMVRPQDLPVNFDCCIFKNTHKPVADDPANVGGGRWTVHLRKGLAGRLWEELLLAIVGGANFLDRDCLGAVVSVRPEADVLAVWADHRDRAATLRLRESVHRVLNLPRNAPLEFKRHGNYAPPAHAGGGCIRYSIGQLLAAKAVTGPPPIYCWESLEALGELRFSGSGGARPEHEGGEPGGGGAGGGGSGRGLKPATSGMPGMGRGRGGGPGGLGRGAGGGGGAPPAGGDDGGDGWERVGGKKP